MSARPRLLYSRRKESVYRVVVRHARESDTAYLYPIRLVEALPQIPVPLRKKDSPVPLDLQPLVNAVYQNGKYYLRMDYKQPPPEPALNSEDAAWCDELLRHAKLRR